MDTQDHAPGEGSAYSTAAQIASESTSLREQLIYPDDQPNPDAAEQSRLQDLAVSKPDQPAPEKPDTAGYQLQMPEGVQVDGELLASAVPVFQELGLSSDQASKLVPLVTQVQERFQQSQIDQLSALSKSWAQEAQADRDLGGKNWKETGRLAGVALKAGGSGESLREAQQLLNDSGLGNHPAMIRLFRNMGAEIERLRAGKESGTVRKSARQESIEHHQRSIYPNDPENRPWSEGLTPYSASTYGIDIGNTATGPFYGAWMEKGVADTTTKTGAQTYGAALHP